MLSKRTALLSLAVLVIAIGACTFFYSSAAANVAWNAGFPGFALALDRSDADLAFKIGDYYYGGGRYDPARAEAAYRKAIVLDPSLPMAHYQLARALFVEDELVGAHSAIKAELKVNPGNFRAFYMQGLIDAYAGHLPEAEKSFTNFIAAAPTEWAGYNDLAWVLGKEEKYAEAEQLLQQALQKIPDGIHNPWLLNNLGVQQLNLKEYAAAEVSFSQAAPLAAALTEDMWHRAYPGNDPAESAGGLTQFRAAIEQNLEKARQEQQKP